VLPVLPLLPLLPLPPLPPGRLVGVPVVVWTGRRIFAPIG